MAVGKAILFFAHIVTGVGFHKAIYVVQDSFGVEQGDDGKNDEGDTMVLDAEHQLFQLVYDVVHRAISLGGGLC